MNSSMLFWYPIVKDLPIRQPKTVFIEVDPRAAYDYADGKITYDTEAITIKAREIGYPLFARTDQTSGKHDWKRTCYVESEDVLIGKLMNIVEFSLLCSLMGLEVNAFFFREYIPMASLYTAFADMPVNPERRYFVENGEVVCHHHYWIDEAIRHPSVENWRELSKDMNYEHPSEIHLLTGYAQAVADTMKAHSREQWSVDFCKSANGEWILIDMALGAESWHPDGCPNKIERDFP